MDQLKSRVVNVVLCIQEGKGMETCKNLILISANFNGRILESDLVTAEDCPRFNTNLVWEIEKRELRKIRSSNQPLRVECISVDGQRRERFGHALLDLRSAYVVNEPTPSPFKWQKLIGVRNKKRNSMPELYFSLTIRNKLEIEAPEIEMWNPELTLESTIPIKYLEDGYIIVGNEEEVSTNFTLNILVKSATNLDLLLPEVLVFHQNSNKYYMSIKVFGIPINTKQFCKDLHDQIIFEEKIVVQLLSSRQVLEQFFKAETFDVGFYCGSDLLGRTSINFDKLTNLNESMMFPNCYFKFPSANGIIPVGDDDRKPSLCVEACLIAPDDRNSPLPDLIQDVSKASGDHTEEKNDQLVITVKQIKDFEDWKERQKADFEAELETLREKLLTKERTEIELKKAELDDNIKKCNELQLELQDKLEDIKVSKALKKQGKSSSNDLTEENKKKFADCDKILLIEYITSLQKDNEHLKLMLSEQRQEFEMMQRSVLTKEQTTNLLQELKGLEEKFEIAQQTKSYFKEQWKKACYEIHHLKKEEHLQMKNQLRERREELHELDQFCIGDRNDELISFELGY